MSLCNQHIVLAARPNGLPLADCWLLCSAGVPAVNEGEVLVEISNISLDPAMRAWMNDYCYIGGVDIGETMRAFAVGTVRESRHPKFHKGDPVRGLLGVQQYAVVRGDELDLLAVGDEPLSHHLGIYGMTGLTAYFGITAEVEVKPGQQVLVSTAAGAVGSVVAQIAKLRGATVVGVAGGADKVAFCVNELGLDGCIDYKRGDFDQQLAALMPNGVDIYFDNVGVPMLNSVLNHINERSTIIVCGAINQFQQMDAVVGPSQYLRLPERHSTLKGFTYFHYVDRFEQGVAQMKEWVAGGQVKQFEQCEYGLENFHNSFNKLFSGDHRGKLIIKP